MHEPEAFDAFRDAHPDWHNLPPIEIAILFWNEGYVEGHFYGARRQSHETNA